MTGEAGALVALAATGTVGRREANVANVPRVAKQVSLRELANITPMLAD